MGGLGGFRVQRSGYKGAVKSSAYLIPRLRLSKEEPYDRTEFCFRFRKKELVEFALEST